MTLEANTFKTRKDAEAHYLDLIDVWAAEQRRIDPAQESIYRRKADQARAGKGALIDAEAEALGISTPTLCQRINTAKHEQEKAWGAVEIQRIKAKADVRKAASPAHMYNIYRQLKELG